MGKQVTNGKDGSLSVDGLNDLSTFAITGDMAALDAIIDQLGASILEELSRPGAPIMTTVNEIRAEYMAVLQIRMVLIQAQAVRTLEGVMTGQITEGAAPAVSAANSVLDRGDFPKRTRAESMRVSLEAEVPLPSLKEIIGDDEEGIDEWLGILGKMQNIVQKKADEANDTA